MTSRACGVCNHPCNYQSYPLTLCMAPSDLVDLWGAHTSLGTYCDTSYRAPAEDLQWLSSWESQLFRHCPKHANTSVRRICQFLLSLSFGNPLCALGEHLFLYVFPRHSIPVFKLQYHHPRHFLLPSKPKASEGLRLWRNKRRIFKPVPVSVLCGGGILRHTQAYKYIMCQHGYHSFCMYWLIYSSYNHTRETVLSPFYKKTEA